MKEVKGSEKVENRYVSKGNRDGMKGQEGAAAVGYKSNLCTLFFSLINVYLAHWPLQFSTDSCSQFETGSMVTYLGASLI